MPADAEAPPDLVTPLTASPALSARLARLLAEIDVRDHALADAIAVMERARDGYARLFSWERTVELLRT